MSAYSILAKHYDSLTTDVPYQRFADFYERLFTEYDISVNSIVDVACGTGTMTYMLAQCGYDIIGVDSSPDMLSVAAQKGVFRERMEQVSASREIGTQQREPVKNSEQVNLELKRESNLGVEGDSETKRGEAHCGSSQSMREAILKPMFICQNMEQLDLYGTSDAVICALDGINYIKPSRLQGTFHRIKLFLNPGGLFIFDINTPYKLRRLNGGVFLDETDDIFCVWRTDYYGRGKKCVYEVDIFEKTGALWKRESEEHTQYAHDPDELKKILESEGFLDVRVMGDLRASEPGPCEERVFIAARNCG